MIRSRPVVTFTLVTAVLLASGSAFAQAPGFGGFRGRGPGAGIGPRAGLPLGQLDLTDTQREQVRQLTRQHREQTRPFMDQLRKAQDAQRQAIETLPLDEGRIRAAAQELARAQADLAVQHARLRSEIYALLTPDQQQRLQQLRAQRQARFDQRRQRMQQRMQQR